jgi:hypothetical protein
VCVHPLVKNLSAVLYKLLPLWWTLDSAPVNLTPSPVLGWTEIARVALLRVCHTFNRKRCSVLRSAHRELWYLFLSQLHVTSACLSQVCSGILISTCPSSSIWVGLTPRLRWSSAFNRHYSHESLRGDIATVLDAPDYQCPSSVVGSPIPSYTCLIGPGGRCTVRISTSLLSILFVAAQPIRTKWTKSSPPSSAALASCGES